jgi:hypothetical protein
MYFFNVVNRILPLLNKWSLVFKLKEENKKTKFIKNNKKENINFLFSAILFLKKCNIEFILLTNCLVLVFKLKFAGW